MIDPYAETDTADIKAFLHVARAAMRSVDPVPEVLTLAAKAAFATREIPTADTFLADELALSRSPAADALIKATGQAADIVWSNRRGMLAGVLERALGCSTAAGVNLQTPAEMVAVEVDAEDGTFVTKAPEGPYRFVVDEGGTRWATSWVD